MSLENKIDKNIAAIGIFLASISNSFTKLLIVFYIGGKRIGILIFLFFLISVAPLLFFVGKFLL